VYAVPFHLHRGRRGKLYGLDAYNWAFLEKRYRVVLLVQPAERLLEEPPAGSCTLPSLVEPEKQLEDLANTARLKLPPPRGPRPSLARRLAELLVPPKLLSMGDPEPVVPEEAQARGLARIIGALEPAGETRWGLFLEQGDALLPADEAMARIYVELRRRDPGYRRGEEEARRRCRR